MKKHIDEDYEVDEKAIAYGTFGTIHRVKSKQDPVLPLVVKTMYYYSNEEINKVEIEQQIQFNHPNIVKIHQVYQDGTKYWLIMDEMKMNIEQYIEEHKDIDIEIVKKWSNQLISAIQYCHSLNIIHCDIKPKNLLIDKQGDLQVCDFGSAKICKQNINFEDTHITTLEYSAPELLSECPTYDHKIDYWSIGCLLYKLLHGYNLFSGYPRSCSYDILSTIGFYLGDPTNDITQTQYPYWPEFCNTWYYRNCLRHDKKHVIRENTFDKIQDVSLKNTIVNLLQINPQYRKIYILGTEFSV